MPATKNPKKPVTKPAVEPDAAVPTTEPETPTVALTEIPEEDTPAAVIERRVKLTDTSMVFAEETTFEEWKQVYGFIDKIHERGKWWLGDVIRHAEGKFPDRYLQAVEITGLSYSRLTTVVSVCSRIVPERRRKEAPFNFHECIAYVNEQTGDYLLDRAIKEKWTRDQLSDAVARAKGEPTKAEKAALKGKPTKTKDLPKKANAQQTLDVQVEITQSGVAPLLWNGHNLATKGRLIYAGPEMLEVQEADRAAHHHNLAHAEALVNFLEQAGFTAVPSKEPASQEAPTPLAIPPPEPLKTPEAPSEPPRPEKTALDRAEEAILAFNLASVEVDWKALTPLQRKKWLNSLLKRADDVIDLIDPTKPV